MTRQKKMFHPPQPLCLFLKSTLLIRGNTYERDTAAFGQNKQMSNEMFGPIRGVELVPADDVSSVNSSGLLPSPSSSQIDTLCLEMQVFPRKTLLRSLSGRVRRRLFPVPRELMTMRPHAAELQPCWRPTQVPLP